MADKKIDLEIIKRLPWSEILDLADELIDGGMDKDEVVDVVAEMLDQMLPLDILFPGVGPALEVFDGPVIAAALRVIIAFAADKEGRASRRAKRQARRAARKERRAARREARNG